MSTTTTTATTATVTTIEWGKITDFSDEKSHIDRLREEIKTQLPDFPDLPLTIREVQLHNEVHRLGMTTVQAAKKAASIGSKALWLHYHKLYFTSDSNYMYFGVLSGDKEMVDFMETHLPYLKISTDAGCYGFAAACKTKNVTMMNRFEERIGNSLKLRYLPLFGDEAKLTLALNEAKKTESKYGKIKWEKVLESAYEVGDEKIIALVKSNLSFWDPMGEYDFAATFGALKGNHVETFNEYFNKTNGLVVKMAEMVKGKNGFLATELLNDLDWCNLIDANKVKMIAVHDRATVINYLKTHQCYAYLLKEIEDDQLVKEK